MGKLSQWKLKKNMFQTTNQMIIDCIDYRIPF